MLPTTSRIKHITLTALTAAALMGASCVQAEDMQQAASPTTAPSQPAQETQSTPPAASESLPAAENPAVTPAAEPAVPPATAPAAAPATAPAATTTTTKPAITGTVSRATFTTNVVNHEPVDKIDSVSQSQSMGKVYYFTVLKGMKGAQVSHRWEFNGKVMAQVDFTVGSPRWRVYSIKTIKPDQIGTWTVSVVDSNGNVLKTDSINVTK